MTPLAPFAYPTEPHVRRHGPMGYKDYGAYKPFLRDDFVFRCVYCLVRELWYPNGHGSYSADHFTPKKIDPDRETDYGNLVYACARCNSFKQATITLLDPEKVAFGDHFRVTEDGRIEGLSTEAKDLVDLLHLDENPVLATRLKVFRVLKIKAAYPDDPTIAGLVHDFFSYPSDLPDLSRLEPPDGNSKREGLRDCHFELKKRGQLPAVY